MLFLDIIKISKSKKSFTNHISFSFSVLEFELLHIFTVTFFEFSLNVALREQS